MSHFGPPEIKYEIDAIGCLWFSFIRTLFFRLSFQKVSNHMNLKEAGSFCTSDIETELFWQISDQLARLVLWCVMCDLVPVRHGARRRAGAGGRDVGCGAGAGQDGRRGAAWPRQDQLYLSHFNLWQHQGRFFFLFYSNCRTFKIYCCYSGKKQITAISLNAILIEIGVSPIGNLVAWESERKAGREYVLFKCLACLRSRLWFTSSSICCKSCKLLNAMHSKLRRCKLAPDYSRPGWNRGLRHAAAAARRSLWEFTNARNPGFLTEDKPVADKRQKGSKT